MSWSIQQVARMAGITARTLRYYDEIGLLPPATVGSNGYRYYERPQMLRLQEVLLLRDLGLDLETIGAVIDAERDPIEALRRHHRRITAERDRLDRLATTVGITIEHLEKGTDMPAENLFRGFEFGPEFVARLQEQTDHPELNEVQRKIADWSGKDFESFNEEGHQLERRLLALLRDGVAAHDERALAVLEDDLELQRKLWTPTKDGYIQLARAITEPSEWRTHLDSLDPRLAGYLRDAMLAYADARMGN
jgi:DNA-binding transcriptional MerR regulator